MVEKRVSLRNWICGHGPRWMSMGGWYPSLMARALCTEEFEFIPELPSSHGYFHITMYLQAG